MTTAKIDIDGHHGRDAVTHEMRRTFDTTNGTTQRGLLAEWAPAPKSAFVADKVELGISDEGNPVISLLDTKGKVRAYGILDFMDGGDAGYEFTGLLMEIVNKQQAAMMLHTYM